MARISVEQIALVDPRIELLGTLLGTSRYDALGRMVWVWNQCLEKTTYTLSARIVGALMGRPDGASLLIESDLAEAAEGDFVRIRGTEGRVEWLGRKRDCAHHNGKRGGRPKEPKENPPETDIGSASDASRFPAETPPVPVPVIAPKEQPVPVVFQEPPGAPPPTSGTDPGRASQEAESMTEDQVDLEIDGFKDLLAENGLDPPANGALARLIRKGARLFPDGVAALEQCRKVAPNRKIRDQTGFYVTVLETVWWERVKPPKPGKRGEGVASLGQVGGALRARMR